MPPVPRSLAQLQGQQVPYEYLRRVPVLSCHTVLVASPPLKDTGVAMNAHTSPKSASFSQHVEEECSEQGVYSLTAC